MIHENIAMFENLTSAIKNEKLDERLRTSITEHLQSFEAEFKRYFPEPKNEKLHSHEIRSQLRWMNYKTNFVIFKMIRPHTMLSRKEQSLSFGGLYANSTHKYTN